MGLTNFIKTHLDTTDAFVGGGLVLLACGVSYFSIPVALVVVGAVLLAIGLFAR